jgi:hypothetical protein
MVDVALAPELAVDSDEADRVAVKAFVRIMSFWRVARADAASLIQESVSTYARMKRGTWTGSLKDDQRLRVSGIIGLYKGLHLYFSDPLADEWPRRANTGPLFRGNSPVEFMVEGGLTAILDARQYVDAIRGGI